MIHFSTTFVVHLLTCCCQFSYTSVVLETSILLLPHSSKTSPLPFHHTLKTSTTMQAPVPETEGVVTIASNLSKKHSLKAAIFHTMAYKLSLEINKNKITPKTLIAFLKVLYNISQIKKKNITCEQHSGIHLAGPKIAISETTSNVAFVLNSSFTSKDQYFRAAIQDAMTAFNKTLQDFGYTQTLEYYANLNIIHLLFLLCHRHWSFLLPPPLQRRHCNAATHFDSTQLLHLTGLQTRKTELNSPRCKHISNYFTQISSITLFINNPHNLNRFCVIFVNPIIICKLSQ